MKRFPAWLRWLNLIFSVIASILIVVGLLGHHKNTAEFVMLAILTFLWLFIYSLSITI